MCIEWILILTLSLYQCYWLHQGIFQLKQLTLHYMNNDQRRMKQEKGWNKNIQQDPAMSGMSASMDLAGAKNITIINET